MPLSNRLLFSYTSITTTPNTTYTSPHTAFLLAIKSTTTALPTVNLLTQKPTYPPDHYRIPSPQYLPPQQYPRPTVPRTPRALVSHRNT